ncbi:MAG: ABC transporter permease [Polyangiales bacterium]
MSHASEQGLDAAVPAPVVRVEPARVVIEPTERAWLPLQRGLAALPLAASLIVVCSVVAAALVPDWLAPFGATDMDSTAILQPPGGAHLLGTDHFGRDVLSLVIYGARQSVLMAVAAMMLSCGVGATLGLIAGYTGGIMDMLLMRVVDIWLAIPNILLALAICTALSPSVFTTILAVGTAVCPRYTRVLRAQALAVRTKPFILAARAAGASHVAILRRHVLPHCFATILVMATLGVGTSILLGTSLSFLGLGMNDDRPDWGYMLSQGRGYLTVAWWSVTFPGLAITLLVISINLLGDALRRRLAPHSAAGGRP